MPDAAEQESEESAAEVGPIFGLYSQQPVFFNPPGHRIGDGQEQVVTQPFGQGDVPAGPEFPDRAGQVGVVEIFQDFESQHAAQADGHIRVAGEVEVDLQGIANETQPDQPGGLLGGRDVKNLVGGPGQGIGNQYLFAQPDDEAPHPIGEILQADLPLPELGSKIVVQCNGAGNQFGEKGDI